MRQVRGGEYDEGGRRAVPPGDPRYATLLDYVGGVGLVTKRASPESVPVGQAGALEDPVIGELRRPGRLGHRL